MEVCNNDDFFDYLFMKHQIRTPGNTIPDFHHLCGIPNYVVRSRLTRVLYDLDFLYVNMLAILRTPNPEKAFAKVRDTQKQRWAKME